MSGRRAALLASLAALTALGLARPATAQFLGDRTEARDCASAVAGDAITSPVNVTCGIPPEQVSEFMRLAVSGRSGDYTELLRRLEALIPATSRLRAEAMGRFFAILGEAEVSPERLTERLVEIAGRYQDLLAQLENTSSADLEVQRLKEQAREALRAGDFDRTEALLNRARARDLSAVERLQADIERMQADLDARQLSAAEAAAENGALMMTRLRYADAVGYYAAAEPLYQRALKITEATLGPEHPDVAQHLHGLALLYRTTGRYAAAELLYQRALAIREKALGPEHPDVAWSLNNLALLYEATGRLAEAEPLYQRAIAIITKTLPADHPHQATVRENYAALLNALGRTAEASELRARAEAIHQRRG